MSDRYFFEEIITPVGRMMMVSDSGGVLRMLEFMVREPRWRPAAEKRFKNAERIEKRNAFGHSKTLARYFDGDLTALDEIPVDSGGTEFQRAVWKALRRIPAGTTTSYGALAKKLGRPETMRAVGLANGREPGRPGRALSSRRGAAMVR